MADPTNNSPPPAANPSPSPAPVPPAVSPSTPPTNASAPTNTSAAPPAGDSFVKPAATPPTDPATAPKAERPAWLPETLWDADKGAKAEDITALIGEATAAREAKAKLPASPDAYQAVLPKIEGLPEGVTVDVNDPRFKAAAALAHKAGLSQEAFSELLGVEAQRVIAQDAALKTAIKARDEALGPNAAARVDALSGFFKTIAPDDKVAFELGKTLFTPGVIEAWERVQTALGSQGVESLRRTSPNTTSAEKIPGYAQMSMRQRLAASEALRAGR